MTHKARIAIELVIILSMCCFPLFYRLDALPIRMWDEARNAVAALEMLQNDNYVVRYFNGSPDTWEVKPPLLIWFQVLSLKIFGVNEFAVRLPSALAALLTALFLIFYFHRFHNNRYIGYLASLVLVTSMGYIERHMARHGDHDALLVLCSTTIILLYYEYLTNSKNGTLKLVIITALLIMGVFTKSIAIMMILPGLLLMTIIYGEHRKIFMNRWCYLCMLAFMLICGSYYLLRENLQPGYLSLVWNEELLPRYFNTNEVFYTGPLYLYVKNLALSRYSYWLYLLVAASIVLCRQSRQQKRSLPVYLIINSVIFLVVISAGTKNIWYDGPLYPLMAVIIALFLVQIPRMLASLLRKKNSLIHATGLLLLAAFFIIPGISVIRKVKSMHEYSWDEELYAISYVLRDPVKYPEIMNNHPFSIVFTDYFGHLLFYTEKFQVQYKKTIPIIRAEKITPGQNVLISETVTLEKINSLYSYDVRFQQGKLRLLRINGLLQSAHPQ